MQVIASQATVKVVGANGQISLGKQFAGRQVLIEEQEAGVWLIRTATVTPARLDLNNPVFQQHLLGLQKPERHAALDTLQKIRQLNWDQLYRDKGLKWEKIVSVKPPQGVDAIYSLRITQARRCTAYRDGDFIRFLTVAPDHDSTYGRK